MTAPLAPQTLPDVSTPEGQRVAAALDRWKRKLLDLSKRNRALNFRPYKLSTVAIVDEQPAEVFRQLYLLGDRGGAARGPFPLGGGGLEQGEGQDGGGLREGNLDRGSPHLDPPPVPTLPLPEGGRPLPTPSSPGRESRYAGLPAESIPPAAYREMILGVLRKAGSQERSELIKEVRALLGYKRTGSKLERAIGSVVEDLLARGVLGEGSSGLRLRE